MRKRLKGRMGFYIGDDDLERLQNLLRMPPPEPLPRSKNISIDKNAGYDFTLEFPVHMTFEEIGRELGVSKQRVFQIYEGALGKIRRCYDIKK
jgi:hypothetical protein